MHLSRTARILLRLGTGLTLFFLYVPLLVIALYAFNSRRTLKWPIPGLTFDWFTKAFENPGVREALWTSLKAATGATLVALLLGTLASLAVSRHRFFGRETISFVLILAIALPGVVTGMALSTTFGSLHVPLGFMTVVIGHATFCIVLVYNNAIARYRRMSSSFEEASADLGADTFQTFRYVTFPALRSALIAGGLLAFALSFDEVIVTIFMAGGLKTLPIWIFQSFRLANQVPLVNVAGLAAILLSVIPVYLATRLSGGVVGARG